MREHICINKYRGRLNIDSKEFSDVICEYEDDYFSNKKMAGEFDISSYISPDELFELVGKTFEFEAISGEKIQGEIIKSSASFSNTNRKNILKFKARSFYINRVYNNEQLADSAEIIYQIPYIQPFSREIRYDKSNDCIIGYKSEPTLLKIGSDDLIIDERIYLTEFKSPDSLFRRETMVTLKTKKIESDIEKSLKKNYDKINDILLLLSFVLEHRFSAFGYIASFFRGDELVQTVEYKVSGMDCGVDLLKDSKAKSNFQIHMLNELIKNYLSHEKKDNIKRIIYRYLATLETQIFEAKFLSSYSLLEGISKLLLRSPNNTVSEKLIEEACKKAKVNIDFIEKKNSKKLEWYITEYRNYLIHFNNDLPVEWEQLINEYRKITLLSRKLIFYIINPEFEYTTGSGY